MRCLVYEDAAVHPIARYVDGLLQLRRHPSRLAFFVMAGLPRDLEPAPGTDIDWDGLINDPRMIPTIETSPLSTPAYIAPSCNEPGSGTALPPARIVRTARELAARGARVSVGSICQGSYEAPMRSFLLSLR